MDYSNCIIYKIKCKDETISDRYVGHTFNLLKRITLHTSSCNNINSKEYNKKLYQVIRAHGRFDKWNIEVVENYTECNSIEDARNKEHYYIESLHANVNCNRPI